MSNDTNITESRKRAKLAPVKPETDDADDNTLLINITDLTNDNLVSIAEYLEKTSRVLFAVALTAPSASWAQKKNAGAYAQSHALSQSIISLEKPSSPLPLLAYDYGPYEEEYQWPLLELPWKSYHSCRWEVLDFSDLDTLLSKRLMDDDVCAVLACINAKDNLKTLKLQGCVNIRGYGLEPLRGSTVLEQVDLSSECSQFQEPPRSTITSTSKLSEEVVTPILLSITSLQQVHLPGKIPPGSTTNPFYSQFQGLGDAYCYVCRKSCDTVDKCSCCTKTYCKECVPVHSCGSCNKKFCLGCQYTIQNEIGFDCGNPDCHVWMGSEHRHHQHQGGGNHMEGGEVGDEDEAINNELLCFSCLDVKCCDHCSRDYCSSCSNFTTCGSCGGTKCEHCFLGCSDD